MNVFHFLTGIMVSTPELYLHAKIFNFTTPNFLIIVKSNFSHNEVFQIKRFSLLIIGNEQQYNFSATFTNATIMYQNFENIHNQYVEGEFELTMQVTWKNVTIISEVITMVNGKDFLYRSKSLTLDYKTHFKGYIVFQIRLDI